MICALFRECLLPLCSSEYQNAWLVLTDLSLTYTLYNPIKRVMARICLWELPRSTHQGTKYQPL